MSLKNVLTVIAILLVAVLTVGLVIWRPMGPENYASGVFNFDAVTQIRASTWSVSNDSYDAGLVLAPEDEGFEDIIDMVDGKGFGRAPGSLFSEPSPDPEREHCWAVTFFCSVSDSSLLLYYEGGVLRISGEERMTVTTQNKDQWAEDMYALIRSLPAPAGEQ